MYDKCGFLGLFAETPLHPGTGSTTGVVDLPVQREKHTGFPVVQSSGLKGAFREKAKKKWPSNPAIVNTIFGPEDSDYAGAVALTDARLLAFPVRSLTEVYVWVTCPAVLGRLKRDMDIAGMGVDNLPDLPSCEGKALVGEESNLKTPLVLEEFKLEIIESQKGPVQKWIDKVREFMPEKKAHNSVCEKMGRHLVVVSDTDYTHLVKTATQVSARIVLNENKTSANLWYEESLPSDCLFYTVVMAMNPRGRNSHLSTAQEVLGKFAEIAADYIQIGGNETVGMGWCAVKFLSACRRG